MTRVLLWVQHLLGTGHTVRAAAIARALVERGAQVTLVVGADAPPTLDLSGLDVIALPPVRAADASFATLLGAGGEPYAQLQPVRAARLVAAVRERAPQVVVSETFPLGRRAFAGEVVPALAAARASGALVAASVRDVLVRKSAAKEAAMAALARRLYDRVLVHADPAFVRLEESFSAAPAIADLVRYTGFVHAPAPPAARQGAGCDEIIVSSGGGGVGSRLVETALAAARLVPERRWRFLLAPALAVGHLAQWRAGAPANATLELNRPDFRALLERAALSVSQAGYNTVLDVLSAGTRAVLVPFAEGEETEQSDRAAALERRGLARRLPEASLTADVLAAAVRAALAAPPVPRPLLDLQGAAHTADLLLTAAEERR